MFLRGCINSIFQCSCICIIVIVFIWTFFTEEAARNASTTSHKKETIYTLFADSKVIKETLRNLSCDIVIDY